MATKDEIAWRTLSLLDLASELSNVTRVCKVMGYPRQQCYEIRRNCRTYGAAGPIDRLPGGKEAASQPRARRDRGGGVRPQPRSSLPRRAQGRAGQADRTLLAGVPRAHIEAEHTGSLVVVGEVADDLCPPLDLAARSAWSSEVWPNAAWERSCRRGVSGILCRGPVASVEEPFAEVDGELCLCLDPPRDAGFHCSAALLSTRYSGFTAASSPGKWPRRRTARRSLEFKASMAFVV